MPPPPSSASYPAVAASVHVKSYWSTLTETFTSLTYYCCFCLPSARRWAKSRQKGEYERLLNAEEEENAQRLRGVSPLLRWAALLYAGRGKWLPDNAQLYAALMRGAGWVQGVRVAGYGGDAEGDEEEGHADADGQGDMKALLGEGEALLRDVARWLTSPDGRLTTENGEELTLPSGNSRQQVQRLIFHSARLLGLPKDTEGLGGRAAASAREVDPAEVVPGLEDVKEGVNQVAEDVRTAVWSTAQMVLIFVTSEQLTNGLRDAFNFGRDILADGAEAAAAQASHVEATVRPSSAERNEPLGQELGDIRAAARDSAGAVASIDPAGVAQRLQSLPQDAAESARRQVPNRRQVAEKVGETIGELMDNDETFAQAVRNLVRIAGKYRAAARDVAAGVVPQELVPASDGDGGADEQPQSTSPQPSFAERHPDLAALVLAARELLEELAGAKSLQPIVDECVALWTEVQDEVLGALDRWVRETEAVVQGEGEGGGGAGTAFAESARRLADELTTILERRPDWRSRSERVLSLCSSFLGEIRREARLLTMLRRLRRMGSLLSSAFDAHARGLTARGRAILHDATTKILPALLKLVGRVPLPRIEFTSPDVDAALDDLSIAAVNLVPARVRLEAKEVLEWDRTGAGAGWGLGHAGEVGMKQVRLEIAGLRLAIEDASFFFREKATQASSAWLNAMCCARPSARDKYTTAGREEEGHLLAYREQALLDVGLFGEAGTEQGADVVIDLEGARTSAGSGDDDNDDESEARTGFFQVKAAALSLSDSFDLNLRQSHHYVLNTALVQPVLRPLLRVILEHVGSSLIADGVKTLDDKAWDMHARAQYLASRREQGGSPTIQDYMRVVMDAKAGKSPERLRREAAAADEAEAEAAKKKREEEEQQQQQRRRQRANVDSPSLSSDDAPARPRVEVAPTGLVLNPTPDISISICAYPTLLPTSAHGPATARTDVRNAAVEGTWREVVRERADQTLLELNQGAGQVRSAVRSAGQAVGEVRSQAREAGEVVREMEGNVERRAEADLDVGPGGPGADEEDDAWRNDGFDL